MKIWLTILLTFSLVAALAQNDCTLKLNKDSINIYSCKVEGQKFKASKSTFYLNSTLSQLAALVFDVDFYYAWNYKAKSARLLKKISDKEIIYHTEVNSPAPVDNRDFVIRLTAEQNPHTKELIIEAISIPGYIPEMKNVVRVPFSRAKWTIKPVSPTRLYVEYYVEIDLGGSVPAWMVNMVAHQAPHETFKALRENIGRYKGKKVSFVKD